MNTKTNQDKLRDAIRKVIHNGLIEDDCPCIDRLLALFENSYKEREKESYKKGKLQGVKDLEREVAKKLQALERTK